MNQNRKAFLQMIAEAEGTKNKGFDGYNVVVGGELFTSYADHPRKLVNLPKLGINSTAAGRYQILSRYWDHYKIALKLNDFSPESQDTVALQLIRECGALDDIDNGKIEQAIQKCASRWASFPGSKYGQRTRTMDFMLSAYYRAGGAVNE